VICNDEDTDGRARVTTDEERVLLNASSTGWMDQWISSIRHNRSDLPIV